MGLIHNFGDEENNTAVDDIDIVEHKIETDIYWFMIYVFISWFIVYEVQSFLIFSS